MSCTQQITIVQKYPIVGSNGTVFWFNPYRQYCYDRTEDKEITDSCKYPSCYFGRIMKHYIVIIEEEEFALPAFMAAIEWTERTEKEQDFRKVKEYYELGPEQPDNWKKEFKEVTGIDVEANECVALNGIKLWLKMQSLKK